MPTAPQASAKTLFRTLASLCDTSLAVILGVALVDYLAKIPAAWDIRSDYHLIMT